MRVDSTGPAIEDLRTFLMLAEAVGVAEVAKRLGVDVSVVSRRLGPFRERYGMLRKQGGSLVLTDRGRDLLPTVRAVVRGYDGLAGQLRRGTEDDSLITIGVGGFGAAYLTPEVVARFSGEAPRSSIKIRVCRGRERVLGVIDGRFDLAVLSHSLEQVRALAGEAAVSVEPLPGRPFVIAGRRDSPAGDALAALPSGAAATIRELACVTLVGLDETSGVRTQLERRAAEAGLLLRFGASGGGWIAGREYARHGLGAAILPVEVLAGPESELTVRRLDPLLSPRDHILYRPASLPRIAALKAVLLSTAEEQCRRQQDRLKKLSFD